jgi:hypothetical protein
MKEATIRVAVFRPGADVTYETLPNELEDMQKLVDGYIETLALSNTLTAICNEDGKIRRLPSNRLVGGPGGTRTFDILVGTFFVARMHEEDFASIYERDEHRLNAWKPDKIWYLGRGVDGGK